MASCSGCGSSGELMSRKRKRTCVEDEEANARRTNCFELVIDLQELFSVDDLLCGDHDDYQVCEEQEDPSNSVSENQIYVGDDMISTVIESTDIRLEEEGTDLNDIIPMDDAQLEDDSCWLVDASLSAANESTDIQLDEGTDQNGSAPAFLEQHQDDDDIIPMDSASYFQSDECS
ncbi:hypothetical protein ACLB2K_045693 [Fragaria x ananassa]